MKRNEIIGEISLGDYRKKAGMQKAQSQMGAMFARDPAEREKNLATFNKREKGLNRLKARDEKSRKADSDKRQADDIAALPKLRNEYEEMKAKYKSLGGSNWQYADREQNLTGREREARSMEGPMNNLWRRISAAEKTQGKSNEGYNPNSVDAEHRRSLEKSHEDSLKKKAADGDESAKKRLQALNDKKERMRNNYNDRMERESIEEGAMKDYAIEQVVDQLLDGELDAYDVLSRPQGPAQEQIALVLQDMYDDVVSDTRLHPDDDFEEIIDRVMDRLEDEYGHSGDDKAIDETGELKVQKDDDKSTVLLNPTTGVQTQIDKTNPNSPRLTQDETGKLKLEIPKAGGTGPEKAPNLVGKDVQVDQMPEMLDIRRLAGLK
jgi:hypothetical protein